MNKNLLLAISLSILFISCDNGVFQNLSRTTDLPFSDQPVIIGFNHACELEITWKADPGADEYLLLRDTSPSGSFSTQVYKGTATSAIQSSLNQETWYYYKLNKTRGTATYTSDTIAFGFSSPVPADPYEPNNEKMNATLLVTAIESNLWYYQDSFGNVVEDKDWFKVAIPPRKSMTIRITSGQASNFADQDLYYVSEYGYPDTLSSEEDKIINNYEMTEGYFYFQIYCNYTHFIADPLTGGGKAGTYRVKILLLQDVEGA
jgi:hypothetical protein